jgi:hypothetical protein
MIGLFIIIQCFLFLFMVLHDWIDMPPFTNLAALKKAHTTRFRLMGSFINGTLVLIPIVLTFFYFPLLPFWTRLLFVCIYGLITFGTITAWWIPYFWGKYLMHGDKDSFEEYRDTHTFLPPRGDNVIPNTLHVILHVQVWLCCGISIYLLYSQGW